MTGPLKVVGFLVTLVAVFAAALGVGYAVGPVSTSTSDPMDGHDADHQESTASATGTELPGGLMVSQDGYTLRLRQTTAEPGRDVSVSFAIEGPDGRPVTAYDVEHGKQLHLIAVRRDFGGFQHVHPELGSDGTWSTDLDLTPGAWRLFTDFNPTGGVGLTLGGDLSVPGHYRPERSVGPVRTAQVDGYTVSLTGDLTPGADSELTLRVARAGRPVTDLQPYLGSYGHLVALRDGDLAYLHVHPEGTPGDGSTSPGPEIVFEAAVPSSGDYRLFLDFRHEEVVRTAEFALKAVGDGDDAGEGELHEHAH